MSETHKELIDQKKRNIRPYKKFEQCYVERDKQTDRQTDRQKDRQTDRHTNR